jgi:hypothetical protein
MASCPVCSADIPDDFGLLECPSCSAQLIVHMDGRVEYSGAQESPLMEPEELDPDDATSVAVEPSAESFEFSDEEQNLELPPEVPEENAPALEFNIGDQEPDEAPPAELTDPFEAIPDEPAAEVYRPAADSPDLSDVADFGNSDTSGRDGSLRYDLIITGIDTADVREAFREAITDRKLVWDIDQILRSLKNGEVRIENVTPPKAYMVISRLRSLPVQVRWEQYAVSQI